MRFVFFIRDLNVVKYTPDGACCCHEQARIVQKVDRDVAERDRGRWRNLHLNRGVIPAAKSLPGRPNVLTLSCKSRLPCLPRKAARRLPRLTRSGRSELQPA